MQVLIVSGALVFLFFSFVVFFGAPYLPVLSGQKEAAFRLLALKPGQHMLELGCGDGRMLIAAAERGLQVTGYELNPVLAFLSWLRTRRYSGQVRVVWGNYWRKPWPPADGIYVFLLDKYMKKLDKKVIQELKRWHIKPIGNSLELRDRVADERRRSKEAIDLKTARKVKLVSYAFEIPGKKPVKTNGGLFLYQY